MKRFLLINNIPTPYRNVLFSLMYKIGREHRIEFSVAFQARRISNRPWKPDDFELEFPHYYSKGWGRKSELELYHYNIINLDIIDDVRQSNYDYVMFSPYMSITSWGLARANIGNGLRLIWCESNLQSTFSVTGPVRLFKSWLLERFDLLVLPGGRALEYLSTIRPGVENKPILWLPNIVDNQVFVERVRRLRSRRNQLRSELGLHPSRVVILGIGQLVPRKGFQFLIEAASRYEGDYGIIILGEGECRSKLERRIELLGLKHRVQLIGNVPESTVALYLAIADWFIHPATGDPSPLAVIEALSAGLPLAISIQTGNSPEVIDEGANGYTFDPTAQSSIDDALKKMIGTTPGMRAAMGERSAKLAAERFEPLSVVSRFYEGLDRISHRRRAV